MASSTPVDREMESVMSEVLSSYGNTLLRMCFLYLKDSHLAEDAVQDTLIKIYKNYDKFEGNSDVKTWVMRIAINVCKNYLRSSWWKRIDESAILENIPVYSSYETNVQDDTVVAEIMKLSPKYKDVIILYYYQEMKIRQISDVLKIPEATVSTRLSRAKNILKDKLGGWYYD